MDRTQLERAARLAGLELAPATAVTVNGNDPVLPTPFHLGEGAATALALVGQEADRIWQLRGGRPQSLSIDVRHAAASLHSFGHLELVGGTTPTRERPGLRVSAIWECGDGRFIHLHSSFNDAPGILAELGMAEDASVDEIAEATRKRGAFELEDALAAKGLCSAVCRTAEEWAAHPQGTLLATKPVVEVTRIGDAPPEPPGDGERPLSGVRVLDVTRVLAGPTCARTLAEHGADVLHIASPSLPTSLLFEMDTGHGKRQAHVDLNDAAQTETLQDLVRGADVFSQGFRLGALARRGFGPEQVAALRPGIIYVSENAFGHEGPWRLRPGWEQLAQATTGVTVRQGGEGRPVLAPAAMNDYATGYFAALGTMMALRRRATEGGSWMVTVSLAQTSMWYYRLGHELDPARAKGIGDVASFLEERDTPYGRMKHLRPALGMSETPPRWDLPTAPLGSGSAAWL
ncbi:MAG: CoA transferase [Dehalococcoidia bacterium]|nr:CoA transferase [Dehalococcoidia bacterium]